KGASNPIHLEEVRAISTAAWPVVHIERARTSLVRGHTRAVAFGPDPGDVSVFQQMRIRHQRPVVLRLSIEKRAGNLCRHATGLCSAIIELVDLKVTVAAEVGHPIAIEADAGIEH